MGLKLFSRRQAEQPVVKASRRPRIVEERFEPADPLTFDEDPLLRQLQLERYGAIVLRPSQWASHGDLHAILRKAQDAIDENFGLVPEGFASLPQTIVDYPGCHEEDVETQPFLMAIHPVTNAQYQKFVDAGGYEELELWPREIWPHLIDFKDQTEQPGPRYWQNGRHNRRLTEHPVVGISFYEAMAYAAWAGFRLPTEAEWQMAASWRIRSSSNVLRRYPWGDALDVHRCNIWASGIAETVPVSAYKAGAAPNGVLQLIGNVWEWTVSDFLVTHEEGRPVVGDMLMKSIRGGAFDTYFACQATSCFRTGLATLSRTHNVGFRCAMDINGRG